MSTPPAEEKVSFSRQILPILSDKCFRCHGPDPSSRMAGMRLDTPEGAFADRGGRWPIVPGKPEDSLIVKRIDHPTSPMPPVSSGKSLSPDEKALIRRWIAEGASYGKLWSFEALPASVQVPNVRGTWAKDNLDRFVQDRLTRAGLKPTREAAPERWLRRVTLDLTGLPPTEQEITGFLQARRRNGEEAYASTVDRLLASGHFGERMASEWLDAARYSDSYGYQSDLLMPTWPYRDWVIRAYNENKPYDQFLIEQIAGDLLDHPSRDQVLATAFNRLHRQSNEGGSIAEEFKTEYAVDRVSTFGTAFLGLTLGCARCHDHKFDPITQREFYQLYAYFSSINEFGLLLSTEIVPTPSLLLPTPEQESKLKELQAACDQAEAALRSVPAKPAGDIGVKKTFLSLDAEPFTSVDGKTKADKLGSPTVTDGVRGKALRFDGDDGLAVRGLPARERWDAFSWSMWIEDPRQPGPVVLLHRTGGTDVGFCGFDLMLEDGYLTARVMRHWPGNALGVRTTARIPKDQWTHLGWSYDGSGHAAGLKLFVNGKVADTTVVADRLWKKIAAYGDLGAGGGDWTFGTRFRDAGFKGGTLDEIVFGDRVFSHAEFAALARHETPPDTDSDALVLARVAVRKAQQEIANFEEGIREISVMEEANPEQPAYLLARGAYDAPKTPENRVQRGVPAALPTMRPSLRNDRLSLARWATSPNHPLTARVAVNRLWQTMFGVGLVETSENFGTQGSQPSNPELLDFLSRRFVDEGWDIKRTLRHIALSATYRQDSKADPERLKVDPQNRLLSRGPSARLSAEMVRDVALAGSGLLTDALGGPPVNPYQPAGIWQENNTMSPGFVQSKGKDLYRRSVYSTWKRTTPVPSMLLFDATSREACTMRRPTTGTPMQALVLLNDIQYVEAARVLAQQVLTGSRRDADRLSAAFMKLAGRKPDTKERAVLTKTLNEQRKVFAADPESAAKLIAVGDTKAAPAIDPVELAATTVVVQTILNSDAVIWKR